MEKELNIAEILKDKPKGLKLWSPIIGDCELSFISSIFNIIVTVKSKIFYNGSAIYSMDFDSKGKYGGEFEGNTIERECVLFPSKSMRDWSKFAWKKGDVLATDINTYCIFDSWENGAYTQFRAKYICRSSDCHFYSDEVKPTCDWTRVKENDIIEYYINIIERSKGGKLNLETLEIEKPQFKDGDIVVLDEIKRECYAKCILAIKNIENGKINYYAFVNLFNNDVLLNGACFDKREPRPATYSEKQQLFKALAKENKAWDAKKKAIVNLPKKCEFKPKDWCLMKYKGHYNNRGWELCQYAYTEHRVSSCGESRDFYHSVGGAIYAECIPYNDQTAHLLGTTDNWKGGEE